MQNERITKFITTFLRVFFLFVSQCQRKPLSLEKNLRTLGTIRTVNPMNGSLIVLLVPKVRRIRQIYKVVQSWPTLCYLFWKLDNLGQHCAISNCGSTISAKIELYPKAIVHYVFPMNSLGVSPVIFLKRRVK